MMNIPVLTVRGSSLAEAYENALVALHQGGIRAATQYDRPDDPLSLDATMNITVDDPTSEPMIHKAFPGGIEDLREYVMELGGVKDHWVKNISDPDDTRWEYTYHGRMAAYGSWREMRNGKSREQGSFRIDQIEAIVRKLSEQPYTRQAQMITWMPNLDLDCYDPPCLQSLWYRILDDKDGKGWLNCNVRFRSNDAWGANFMNMFGLVQFNRLLIADQIEQRTGRKVGLGRMNWQADSFHIYGKDIEAAEQRLFRRLDKGELTDRTYRFSDPLIQEIYGGAEEGILKKIADYDSRH